MRITTIYKIINRSSSPQKENLKEVIRILRRNNDFFIFFLNIAIDFRIWSIDQTHLLAFFNNFTHINTALSPADVASALHSQIQNYFGTLLLNSQFNFTPNEAHLNIISYDTFHEEHYPQALAVTLDDIYDNPQEFVEEKLNEDLDGAASLRVPWRKKTLPDGRIRKRLVWLAKYAEVENLVSDYARRKGASKSAIQATAVNDILGLGFKDYRLHHDKTLLLYLKFPENFSQKCYKPTFVEGPLWGYRENLFLNSIDNNGYGATRSTDKGFYAACECVTDGVDDLTDDFELGILGYAETIIDRSNMRANAVARLLET